MNPTNETLSDKNPISNRIFEVAGPELKDECQNQIGSRLPYCFAALFSSMHNSSRLCDSIHIGIACACVLE